MLLRIWAWFPEGYSVNHFLTDNDAWFLLTDCPDGFKHFERSPLSTSMEGDFDTGNVRFKARERYSFGFLESKSSVCISRGVSSLKGKGASAPFFLFHF